MLILGISAYYHDSAAALVRDGQIVSAAQEERFSRKKHDPAFPGRAIAACLDIAGIEASAINYVVFYDKPFLKFERLLETYLAMAPKGFESFKSSMPIWLREKLYLKDLLVRELGRLNSNVAWKDRLLFSEHHLSHSASAFFASPYEDAAVLTLDGVGEWATTSLAVGRGNSLETLRELHFPHSLGLLYSAFTYYTGFKVNSGEYKLMGLAPYGEPKYAKTILERLIDVKPDGSFRLNMEYFNYCTGLTMTSGAFHELLGGAPRKAGEEITQRHMDLASSIQAVTEEILLKLTRATAKSTGSPNLCLAGGVALNCVANGKILRDGHFKRIWIQPAAGDAGGAIGAALAVYHIHLCQPRLTNRPGEDLMRGSYLGPEFGQDEIEARLRAAGARFHTLDDHTLYATAAAALVEGKAIGWFQGRMEFGPRALGNRSILADPRAHAMQRDLNLKIKYRESFRPFAPAVLAEEAADWFDLRSESPYMLYVADVHEKHLKPLPTDANSLTGVQKLSVSRSDIPAVTHVDNSARIQTVHRETNPRFHALISAFKESTGCPVLINTSFNIRGEPIVCTPEDSFRCFMGTEIELLAVGNCVLHKSEQNPELRHVYRDSVELD